MTVLPLGRGRRHVTRSLVTIFRPDVVFEVGLTKAVLGLEIDLMWGQVGPNDGGFASPTPASSSASRPT
jgi:hypothetical protein